MTDNVLRSDYETVVGSVLAKAVPKVLEG